MCMCLRLLCISLVLDGKESACNVGDTGSIPGSGRSPGEGNGYPLQYSCLENSMERGTWRTEVHGVAKTSPRIEPKSPAWQVTSLPLSHQGSS